MTEKNKKMIENGYVDLVADADDFSWQLAANIGCLATAILKDEKLQEKCIFGRQLLEAIETLTEREQKVLQIKFGLTEESQKRLSLGAVGEKFGISRERVRAIEARAFRKLRNPARSSSFYSVYKERKAKIDVEKRVRAEECARIEAKRREEIAEFAKNEGLKISEEDWNSIETLGFSTRAYKSLMRCGVQSILELKLVTSDRLAKVRNLGPKTYDEISAKREELGVPLK